MVHGCCPQRTTHWLQLEGKAITYLGSNAEPAVEHCNSDGVANVDCDSGTDSDTDTNSVANSHTYTFSHANPAGGHGEWTVDPVGRIRARS